MNQVFLAGNLGKDAALSYSRAGNPVVSFTLATEKKWRDKDGEMRSETMWHTVNLWGPLAEKLADYLLKGTPVAVSGSIKYSVQELPDGQKKYYTAIEAKEIKFFGKMAKKDDVEVEYKRPAGRMSDQLIDEDRDIADDLPF